MMRIVLILFVWVCSAVALAQDFTGSWSGGQIAIELQTDGRGGYTGTVLYGGNQWPLLAQTVPSSGIAGVAEVQGEYVAFMIQPDGSGGVWMRTETESWNLTRATQARGFPSQPVQPLASGPPAVSPAQRPGIARSPYGVLTEDAAMAYYEALVFSMRLAGVQNPEAQVPAQQVVQLLGQNFPQLPADTQQSLVQARAIWTHTQQNWSRMSAQDQQAFVGAVLELAFGSQGSQSGQGQSQSAGTAVGSELNFGYEGSGCWASAGCGGYEPSTDTYSYDSY